jgi:hypothetical protein
MSHWFFRYAAFNSDVDRRHIYSSFPWSFSGKEHPGYEILCYLVNAADSSSAQRTAVNQISPHKVSIAMTDRDDLFLGLVYLSKTKI